MPSTTSTAPCSGCAPRRWSAGADCCVTSLWKVDDRVTAELMTQLYAARPPGLDWPATLRAAQLTVRERQPEPFYWAAWVAEGA